MASEEESIKEIGAKVAADVRELQTNWRLRAHLMEYVTRRPQGGIKSAATELAEQLYVSESSVRRELPALFGDRRPWTPPDGELLESPIVCYECEFTTALTKGHIEVLFGYRKEEGRKTARRQSYCRWCRPKAGKRWRERCDGGRVSSPTKLIWASDGMLFDKHGRCLKASESDRAVAQRTRSGAIEEVEP